MVLTFPMLLLPTNFFDILICDTAHMAHKILRPSEGRGAADTHSPDHN